MKTLKIAFVALFVSFAVLSMAAEPDHGRVKLIPIEKAILDTHLNYAMHSQIDLDSFFIGGMNTKIVRMVRSNGHNYFIVGTFSQWVKFLGIRLEFDIKELRVDV